MATKKPIKKKKQLPVATGPIKIDLGCGKNKREGFIGMDVIPFEGVDIVVDIGKSKWPFKDNTVDEVHASHFVEHLLPAERIHFVNELQRVLKPAEYTNGTLSKGFATIIVPHWASQRAYGDLTHVWPPVSEFWFYYLDKDWRTINAPHNQDYKCHLSVTWGYNMHQELSSRNTEYQQNAMKWWKEACSDLVAQISKKP